MSLWRAVTRGDRDVAKSTARNIARIRGLLTLRIAAAVLGVLAAAAARADDAQSTVLNYAAAYFAAARPNTAYDMISRLPGFYFDDGNSLRGFAGTAGNVLIDGQRPTSKTDDLQSILQRIPAADVERIEIIRGGAAGIDMQGQTVVANVIRKKGDSTRIVADLEDNFWPDGHTAPMASLQFTQHSGDSTYEGSLTRYGNFDDSVGNGFHDVTDASTGAVAKASAHTTGFGTGGGLTGAATIPLFGGQFKANIALQASPFHSSVAYAAPGDDQLITDFAGNNNGELGLHWTGKVGGVQLETLLLQRLGHATDVNTSIAPADDQQFTSTADTGESIARATLRYLPVASLTLEGGAEAAFNYLDGRTGYTHNGVAVPLPSANAYVEERRGEVFGQGTWKITDAWMLEAGARFEFSTIGEIGDVDLTRKFFYPKPRVIATWTPDKGTQVRLRYERVLGQLDFNNFIATSSLASTGVTAGNPNLEPDQHSQYEISFEKDFWDKGALVATLMHERISDVEDYVPVTGPSGTFDAPGNIGTGHNTQIDIELTVPLDRIGLKNGLLKTTNIWRISSVGDPVTGQSRVISGERPQDIEWTLTQDIDSLKSTWGIFYFNCWNENFYRVEQVQHLRTIPPYLSLWWEYKPTSTWSLHVELDNVGRFGYEDAFSDYAGPRNAAPLQSLDELYIKSQPRLYIQIRKTFD
jgi:outer membrane receptor protein involved in Fe transport